MSDTPWPGDACSLVDAFGSVERSPVEELEATLAPHHRDAELFDVALAYERDVGWPLVAPTLAASQR